MMAGIGKKRGGQGDTNVQANCLSAAIHEVFLKMHPDPVTGLVGRDDISQGFLEVADHELTEDEADALVREIDHNDGSGTIKYEDFASWMMTSSKLAVELRHKVNTVAVGTLDNLINDQDIAKADREQGDDESILIWQSEEGFAQTLWVLLEEPGTSTMAFWTHVYVQMLIVVGSLIFIVETLETVKVNPGWLSLMHVIEWFCVAQFTFEYFGRIFCAPFRPGDRKPPVPGEMIDAARSEKDEQNIIAEWEARPHLLPYVVEPMNIVDLVAILPAYLDLAMDGENAGGLAVLRILRLARIFRMIKIGSYAENLSIVLEALKRSKTGLLLMIYLVILFTIVMASLLYMVEGDPQVEGASSSVFVSIPHTFWCIIVTMSSVGYGDMFPTSDIGRFIGSFVMVTGILTLAVPITLIGNRFNEAWLEHKQFKKKQEMVENLKQAKVIEGSDATGGSSPKVVSEEEAELKLKQLKTALYLVNLMLEECFTETGDDRFHLALDMVKPAQDEILYEINTRFDMPGVKKS